MWDGEQGNASQQLLAGHDGIGAVDEAVVVGIRVDLDQAIRLLRAPDGEGGRVDRDGPRGEVTTGVAGATVSKATVARCAAVLGLPAASWAAAGTSMVTLPPSGVMSAV